ncbi:MAG: hypothetical protein NZ455_08400 [Bacteroidia bacterium]|nr:hypothetical protein [Bacteroidia bacterium]MDW8345496.1 hypothetical protein [Bacteroidia bacterium]
MGVPLANARVGAFRTALRYGANALPNGMLHAPHAGKSAESKLFRYKSIFNDHKIRLFVIKY